MLNRKANLKDKLKARFEAEKVKRVEEKSFVGKEKKVISNKK
jgi:hypothetical protein